MQYDVCLKCTSLAALIAALTPYGLTTIDEAGADVLLTASHGHALAYAGRVAETPAEINPEGHVTVEATYWPGEYAILRAAPAILDRIAGAAMAGVEVLDTPPAGCPTFGDWRPRPAGPSLEVFQAAACARIDAAAEALRLLVLTPGAGQMAAYQAKEAQASAFLEDEAPTEAAYPDIYNEVGITADTAGGVADLIMQAAAAWRVYGRQIERVRLAAKKAIGEATTAAAVAAVLDGIVWPEA